ncbi:hypothetical protein QEG73_21895 [Chitinophagaceae bacterium 26-R-25]|nr:hypothetical protein [Chitinophagaceae bacterium 26-R-25]
MVGDEYITLSEVLEYIDSGRVFNMVHVTADINRGTGGQVKERNGWKKCLLESTPDVILKKNSINKNKEDRELRTSKKKMIINPATMEIRPVHIRLICKFNGKRVV